MAQKSFKTLLVLLVLAVIISEEVDARRTILKGRKTITRTYFRESSIAAWGIILIVALGEIIVGVIMFFIMKRMIIDPPITGSYTPASLVEP